ncbi:heme-degrading domain-containing protein [Priestia sp. GS2]|uniref:heme-degrading domain-containing protein n=1 Tax=Priestia sp. GS2 TaxID=3117403 RepID=UPI002EDA641D
MTDHSVEKLLEKVVRQEKELVLQQFTNDQALQIGTAIIDTAKSKGKAVTVNIKRNGQTLFHYAMEGAIPDHEEWIKRKSNVVLRHHHSSYYMKLYCELKDRSYEQFYAADPQEFEAVGGSFPISIKNVGVVGSVTVSGMSQEEDHALVAGTIRNFL